MGLRRVGETRIGWRARKKCPARARPRQEREPGDRQFHEPDIAATELESPGFRHSQAAMSLENACLASLIVPAPFPADKAMGVRNACAASPD